MKAGALSAVFLAEPWAFHHSGYLTSGFHLNALFMDLFNNELIAYSLSDRKGNPNTYQKWLRYWQVKMIAVIYP